MKKILHLLFLSVFFTELGFYLSNTQLTSLSNNISIFLLLILFIITFNKLKKIDFISLLVVSISMLMNYFIKESLMLESNSRDLIYLFILIVSLLTVKNIRMHVKDFNLLKFCLYIITTLHFVGSFNPSNYGFYPMNYLMFGYSNPNVFSSILLTNVIFITVFMSERKIPMILDWIMIITNIYLISLTDSRTGLITSVFISVLVLFRHKLPHLMIKISGHLSVVFPILFIPLKGLSKNVLSFVETFSETKKVQSLNGRDYIWSEQFKLLFSNVIYFFIGAQPPNQSLTYRNSHNYLLSIFFKHGLIIFLMYIYILFRSVKCKLRFNKNIYNSMSVLGWFVVIISNTFESYLTSGLISISIIWVLLLSDIDDKVAYNK